MDLILDRNNSVYVLEVNSSPALNEPNIGRWVTAIGEYLENPNAAAVDAPEPFEVRDRGAEERERAANLARQNREVKEAKRVALRTKLIEEARREGFDAELILRDL